MCRSIHRVVHFSCVALLRTFLFYRSVSAQNKKKGKGTVHTRQFFWLCVRILYRMAIDMSDVYTVSVFIDKSDEEEENSIIGGRFIPYFYDLMCTHKNVLFLVPFDFCIAQSVMRTIHNMQKQNPEFSACCRGVYSFGGTGVGEHFGNKNHVYGKAVFLKEDEYTSERHAKIKRNKKMVDISDLSLFYVTKRSGRVDSTLKYAKEANKEYIKMN